MNMAGAAIPTRDGTTYTIHHKIHDRTEEGQVSRREGVLMWAGLRVDPVRSCGRDLVSSKETVSKLVAMCVRSIGVLW